MFFIKYNILRLIRSSAFGKSKLYFQIRYLIRKNKVDEIINRFCGTNISQERRMFYEE